MLRELMDNILDTPSPLFCLLSILSHSFHPRDRDAYLNVFPILVTQRERETVETVELRRLDLACHALTFEPFTLLTF